jgi:hypothetical protein
MKKTKPDDNYPFYHFAKISDERESEGTHATIT